MTVEFIINTEEKEDITIFKMEGDITSFSEKEILLNFDKKIGEGKKKIIFDFSKVEYINSAGIGIIIQALSKAKKNDVNVLCSSLSPHFQKIFEMVGLKKYTKIYQTIDEAIQNLNYEKNNS
jgi:anti-anti-sigma factor